MKRKAMPLLLVCLMLSTHAPLAFAQQSTSLNNWSAVQQLGTNERLVVKQKSGKEIKGLMIEATDTTLTIDRDGKPLGIPRADVRQVHVIEGKASKGKWALIGAGIGAGTGTAIGYGKYSPDSDDSEVYIVMGLLIGAGTGALGGLLFGQTKRKRTMVYSEY
ncbi:MAG TPA: hypothetical protein VJP89_00570 [Pyrinomonadaceae bacterium]|nr:hypothetical protein [Pyrinomonadaceae bacterium]